MASRATNSFIATAASSDAALDRLAEANRRVQDQVASRLGLTGPEPLDLLFRAMIDQVPDYLFVKDVNSRFVVANRAVAADIGSDPEEIIGKTDFQLHPPQRAAKFYADEQHVIATGEALIDIDEFVEMRDGTRRYLLTTKVPLRDASGRIIGIVGISRDVTARRQAEAEVQFLAHHDPLTRLPNRRLLHDRLSQAILRARREDRELAVAFIDLDAFKAVNDNHGHSVGDAVLKAVATRLTGCVRATDTVARLGGDEFVVLLDGQDDAAATRRTVLDKIDAAVAKPVLVDNHAFRVGCSIGLATFPDDGSDAITLLRAADHAMYAVKSAPRRSSG